MTDLQPTFPSQTGEDDIAAALAAVAKDIALTTGHTLAEALRMVRAAASADSAAAARERSRIEGRVLAIPVNHAGAEPSVVLNAVLAAIRQGEWK